MTEIINGIPQPVDTSEVYIKATYFETVASGVTSGTITKPAGNKPEVAFVMNDWGTDTDALVSTMSNGKPTWESPVDSGGNNITTTLNTSGEYAFSGTPSPAGDHAVIFVYKCYLKNFNLDESLFESELVPATPGSDHTIASHSDTTATGAELETLTDGSDADSLHVHPVLVPDSGFTQDSGVLVGTGVGTWQEETGATLRTSIGVDAAGTINYTHPNHSGEVTSVADGAQTITANAVTNAKAAQMATKTYKGRTTAGTGNAEDVPVATVKTDLVLVKADVGLGNVENTAHSTDAHTMAIDGRDVSVDGSKLDGIEALADVTDAVNIASSIVGVADKATPVDADSIALVDSAAANVLKEVTWTNIKAFLKTYFDTLYEALGAVSTHSALTTGTHGVSGTILGTEDVPDLSIDGGNF